MKQPRLHLRDLFWLILAAALAMGWWVERGRILDEAAQLREQLRAAQEITIVGEVTAVDSTRALVEISLGADDGLKRGQTIELFREATNLARTSVGTSVLREVGADRSVGMIQSSSATTPIQKGDTVVATGGKRIGKPIVFKK